MMQSDYIEFDKKREIGDIITDTFKFLRKNSKKLFPVLLKTLLIPYILLIVAIFFYSSATSYLTNTNTFNILDGIGDNVSGLVIGVLALFVTGMIYSGLLYGSVTEYMKEYNASNGNPNIDTVLRHIKDKTGSFITLAFTNVLYIFGIPMLLAVAGGAIIGGSGSLFGIFFIIAAFIFITYSYTKYSVIFPSLINKNNTVNESFSTSGKLIKDEWWMTFLTLFLLGLITGVISFVFQIPATIYTVSKEFVKASEYSAVSPSTDWLLVIFQTLASAISYILYVIIAVASNLIYFNLNERKNQTGSLDRINTIGGPDEI